MAFFTGRPYKAWKTSPPPNPVVVMQSSRKSTLLRQVSDEDLTLLDSSNESSSKYLKVRVESRNQLHSNERRRYPTHQALQPKQSRKASSRILRGFLGLFVVAPVVNLVRLKLIFMGNKVEQTLPRDKSNLRKEHPKYNSRMLYLDNKYNVVSAPYRHYRVKGRKILDPNPAEETDVTQIYDTTNSNDVRLETMEKKFFPEHETNKNCVPMSQWQLMSFPTCNSFHEMEMTDHQMLATGNWRDTWLRESNGDQVILKTIRYQHTFQERYYEFSRVDALAMERLTSNPYIMAIHGFCGVSTVTEQGKYPLGLVIAHLKPRDKLIVAFQVATSIASVHEIDGVGKPVGLVHNDINIDNIFWGTGGPLLNDFNIAVLMMKDKKTQKSCPFTGHFPNPQWKAPEEQSNLNGTSLKPLDEKVDIYALGNLLFRFATGSNPWRDDSTLVETSLTREQKDRIAYLKSVKGATPKIPKETKDLDDPYVKAMLEAMKMCYRFKPSERPTARGLARFLKMSLDEIDELVID